MLVIPIFISHKGCPHDCLFCNQQRISGAARGRNPAPGEITQTIEEWLAREKGCRQEGERNVQVAFFGGSFTCLPHVEQEVLLREIQPFLRRGAVHSVRCSTRPDCIDKTVCTLLQKYGVSTVELGVQSMSDRVLMASRRGHTASRSREAIALLKAAGFTVGVQLMPGLPGESRHSFFKGLQEILSFRPAMIRLYPALVIEESAMVHLYEKGEYKPLSLSAATCICAAAWKCCERVGVSVIRMGLQPSDTLQESIVAGPYHPAFGELVSSRLWLQRLLREFRRLEPGKKMQVTVSHRDISAVTGVNKENRKRLDALGFRGRYVIVADRAVAKGSLYVVSQ